MFRKAGLVVSMSLLAAIWLATSACETTSTPAATTEPAWVASTAPPSRPVMIKALKSIAAATFQGQSTRVWSTSRAIRDVNGRTWIGGFITVSDPGSNREDLVRMVVVSERGQYRKALYNEVPADVWREMWGGHRPYVYD